jgi:hypothetical protein
MGLGGWWGEGEERGGGREWRKRERSEISSNTARINKARFPNK